MNQIQNNNFTLTIQSQNNGSISFNLTEKTINAKNELTEYQHFFISFPCFIPISQIKLIMRVLSDQYNYFQPNEIDNFIQKFISIPENLTSGIEKLEVIKSNIN